MSSILIVSLILKFILWRENQRRDNLSLSEYEQELARCGTEPCDSVSRKKAPYYFYSLISFFSIQILDILHSNTAINLNYNVHIALMNISNS
jgi:hypothetical protein